MNYGFQEDQGSSPDDEFMKRLKAMLNDTGFAGLRGLLSQLFGGVAPTEGLSSGAGLSGGGTPGGGTQGNPNSPPGGLEPGGATISNPL